MTYDNIKTVFDFSGREMNKLTCDDLRDHISSHVALIRSHSKDVQLIERVDMMCAPDLSKTRKDCLLFIESVFYQIVLNILIRHGELAYIDGMWRKVVSNTWEEIPYAFSNFPSRCSNSKETL